MSDVAHINDCTDFCSRSKWYFDANRRHLPQKV